MLVLPMLRLFTKLLRKLYSFMLGPVIDAAVNHVVIILQSHLITMNTLNIIIKTITTKI